MQLHLANTTTQDLEISLTACLNLATIFITNPISRDTYSSWPEEAIVVNALGMVLVALGILVSFAVRSPTLRNGAKVCDTERL